MKKLISVLSLLAVVGFAGSAFAAHDDKTETTTHERTTHRAGKHGARAAAAHGDASANTPADATETHEHHETTETTKH